MSAKNPKVWLVTGCSTGFGRYIAEHLLEAGEKVVVTARQTDNIADLEQSGNALILPLDVTDREQCQLAVEAAVARFGRVDVLINNAGIGFFGAIEETDEEDARRLFDVNFFGTANAIHAVLPHMRARRSGTIVNMTSIGGLVGYTGVGYYCATKFAVEGLSDTLRAEVEPLGINVMTVEPSAFRTEWAGSSDEVCAAIDDYDSTAGEARRAYHASVGKQAGDPARAAKAIREAVLAPEPPHHLLLGNDAADAALKKADALKANVLAWEALSRSADFPAN
ncbi:short-chain dehydrogenase/reductase [Sinorhizobium medicae]|uniref:Short-chain dehydrogenase/reductase n=1 Tax=Sinorhizobium medicae TaxID=110321 RepID=A0ABX4TF01_9HYPH|nr:oxidoreductase [Sinorhizobium medicae]MBO1945373.1 SDR family NAD(P)-dependent oxidoreductase [Sinorhizobium medicae]MDX0855659.1 SDR family NAD(P)-dependent oxidoreductase [Sinorhizobium medicae]MDX0867296.1 SDR family NAD(P)-dependent oxidoreductase [Sinorhizobium medicae]MDX0891763.1 SDR family NAD(P)-dependent oxidoreductase [Sinorhizobium medicae]MDX1210553.1 SDR family NAD(P)-dependent oxidoreductase [Sinorhizobium medicae]